MEQRQRVGIGKVVMRDKQYLAAVRPYGKGLALSTMLFADEVVPQSEIEGLPARKPAVSAQEKKLAGQIVDALERDWDPKRYHDTYQEQLRDVINAKQKGKTLEVEEEPEEESNVVDLMAALEASLDRRKGRKRSTGAKRTAKKTAKRTKSTRTSKRTTRTRTAARRSA